MLTVRTKVTSRLKSRLLTDTDAPYYGKTLNLTSTSSSTPTAFPTLNVDSLGEPSMYNDLEHNHQNCIMSTIELKAYTAKTGSTLEAARTILAKATDLMTEMRYEKFFGDQDVSTSSYNCVVARFRRYAGDGDSLY